MIRQETEIYDLESTVLGCFLLDGSLMHETILTKKHFSNTKNQIIFEAMYQTHKKGEEIELISIAGTLKGSLNEIGGLSKLNELMNATPTSTRFAYYQSRMIENHNKRTILQAANKIIQKISEGEDVETLLHLLEQAKNIEQVEEEQNMKGMLLDFLEYLETPKSQNVVKTGYKALDDILHGYDKTHSIIIGARPGVGKTAYALDKMTKMLKDENTICVFFSLEMSFNQLLSRVVGNLTNIHSSKVKDSSTSFSEEDWTRVQMVVNSLYKDTEGRFFVYDKTKDINEIKRICHKLRLKNKDKKIVVFIDYLQLIIDKHTPNHYNRTQEIGSISRSLKGIAHDNEIVVISLSQLSRDLEKRQDKRPTLADLRESGEIEQDADVVQFLYREDYHDKSQQDNTIEVIVAKNRHGECGIAKLAFLKQYFKFADLDTHH